VAEVAPSNFVAVDRYETRTRTALLSAVVRVAVDESWRIMRFFNPIRGEPCEAFRTQQLSRRCVGPHTSLDSERFADARCTEPVATPLQAWGTPTVILDQVGYEGGCSGSGDRYDLYEAGEAVDTVYELSTDGQCRAVSNLEGRLNLRLGDPIDPETLPAVEPIDLGTGDVRARFWGAEGVPFLPIDFVGRSTGEECYERTLSDGEVRCVPSTWLIAAMYAREDCSGGRVAVHTGCAPHPAGLLVSRSVPPGCPTTYDAFQATAHQGPVYRQDTAISDCTDILLSEWAQDTAPFVTGGSVEPGYFSKVEVRVAAQQSN
jgi:hypothetical protein